MNSSDATTPQRQDGDPARGRLTPIVFLLLIVIALAAGGLRFADLDGRPRGFFRDEAEKGYNAWALSTTGGALHLKTGGPKGLAPQWAPLPWTIDVMGARTSAIYQYAAAPFVKAGGLSAATTRMPAAAAGTLTVLLTGLTVALVWGAGAGLTAALALALSPWHLVFSRWALQGIFVPLFVTLTMLGLAGVERRRAWGWPLAAAAMGWMFYAYSGAQPFVLAWGLCLLAIYGRSLWPKTKRNGLILAGAAVLFLIPVIPTALARLAPGGSERMSRVAIWGEPNIGAGGVAWAFVKNYFAHLNPLFLFVTGDAQPRHAIPNGGGFPKFMGMLNAVEAILIPLGLVCLIKNKTKWAWALIAAALCGPVPAALTRTGIPHALRSIAMLAPLTMMAGIGFAQGLGWAVNYGSSGGDARQDAKIPRILLGVLWCALAMAGVVKYWSTASDSPEIRIAFEDGQRMAWERIAAERQPNEKVWVDARLPLVMWFHLFYMRPDPREVERNGLDSDGFIYYDAGHMNARSIMKPGDWLVGTGDWNLAMTPGEKASMFRRIGEVWVEAWRKPGAATGASH